MFFMSLGSKNIESGVDDGGLAGEVSEDILKSLSESFAILN